jgi:RNA polymerase sigma-70 factor (ECF subfamily)
MAPDNTQTFPSSTISLSAGSHTSQLEDLETVVALYRPRVFRFLLANLRDRDAAETLTQETFLHAWTARTSFREDCSVGTWLIRIALNLARDHTRTGRFRFWKHISNSAVDVSDVAASVPSREGSAESLLLAQEQVKLIWETVAHLSPRQRSIFLLRFLEEMDIPEISIATGLPLGTVKSHLYRALNVIRSRHSSAAQKSAAKETP